MIMLEVMPEVVLVLRKVLVLVLDGIDLGRASPLNTCYINSQLMSHSTPPRRSLHLGWEGGVGAEYARSEVILKYLLMKNRHHLLIQFKERLALKQQLLNLFDKKD